MISYYNHVPHIGTFPYAELERRADKCDDKSIIVEVGAFLGHGTCFLAECLKDLDKRPKFYAIDMWDEPVEPIYGETRSGNLPWGEPIADFWRRGGSLYDQFRFHLENCPAKDFLYDHVQFPSAHGAEDFENNSVDFVFLNYSKLEENIDRDVKYWWPKLKSGGLVTIGATESYPIRSMLKA